MVEVIPKWYTYGVHCGHWKPGQFYVAQHSNKLSKYKGTSGGLLKGVIKEKIVSIDTLENKKGNGGFETIGYGRPLHAVCDR